MKKLSILLAVLAALTGFDRVCAGVVAVSLTPNAVSNTYTGTITLQVTGLASGASVVVQKYLDINTNGLVDAGDLLVQQFNLTDGQATVFSGQTNFNVPGDTDTVAGQITATLIFQTGDIAQNFTGQYAYVVSSGSGAFSPITNFLSVTNTPYPQSLSGHVVNSGTNVPYAAVILFQGSGGHDMNPVGAAVANNLGVYTIPAPPGTYALAAFSGNFVSDATAAANLVLGGGMTLNTNLNLITTTASISGKLVDTNSPSLGLPGVFLSAETQTGLLGICFTDTNGNFTVRVTPGQWKIKFNSGGLLVPNYVGSQNKPQVDTTGGSVSGVIIGLSKATAMFYGTILDGQGNALAGVSLFSQDNNGQYESDVISTGKGKYWAGVVGGLSGDTWNVQIDSQNNPGLAGYLFSQPNVGQNGGTNIGVGQAVRADFTAIPSTGSITGSVKSNGVSGISGVGVNASATINGVNYNVSVDTDGSGNYSLLVANGDWDVNVVCDGGNSLSSLGNYQCPGDQHVTIANGNGVVNFSVQTFTTFLSGRVVDDGGNPVTFMNVFAFPNGGNGSFQATTDGGGSFQMGIVGGSYTLALNNDPNTGFPTLNLVGPSVPVSVTDGVNINNFILVAPRVTGAVHVQVNNPAHAGVAGIGVYATLTNGVTNYTTFGSEISTDSSGAATLPVFNGIWLVNLDGNTVQNLGYTTPPSQNVTISGNTGNVTFNLSGGAVVAPVLSSPFWRTNQFQMRLTGTAGQNYTVQASTNLSNWTSLYFTNNPQTNSFILTDPGATNKQRSYRILIGP